MPNQSFSRVFYVIFGFWHYYCNNFKLRNFLMILRYFEILSWKFCNYRTTTDCCPKTNKSKFTFFYRGYEALAKYIKPFLKKTKNINIKGRQCPDYSFPKKSLESANTISSAKSGKRFTKYSFLVNYYTFR